MQHAFLLGLLTITLCNSPALAAPSIDPAQRQDILVHLAVALRDRYVYPDLGAAAADRLTANAQQGLYGDLTDPVQLAARLNQDLAAITHDAHLRVIAPGSPSDLPPPPPSEAGVVRADRMSGGVGYVEISSFPPIERFKPVIDRAMTALAGSRALVIDDRRNTGGDPASVAYLVSFLTRGGEQLHINDIVARQPGTRDFTRTAYMSQKTSVSFSGLPIYILVSDVTFSGGEEFAYDVQNLRLGAVVGEATRGGANPTDAVAVGQDLVASVPWGRAENPVTKTNWEGKGVRPDIEASASAAFGVAMARLGQVGTTNVAAASQDRVFAPRSTPAPGSAAALRKTIESTAAGSPDYADMTAHAAVSTRRDLQRLQRSLADIGAVKSLVFQEVDAFGGDVYDVTFSRSVMRCAIALAPDGKVDAWGVFARAGPETQ